MPETVTVKCPATSANLGSGFDVCGIALESPFDMLTAKKSSNFIVRASSEGKYSFPDVFNENTCGPVAKKMLQDHEIEDKVEIIIKKDIKPASGLGSSAATAAGCAFALNELFSLNISKENLVEYACLGEIVAAGSPHLDNVTPALFGGFTVTHSANPVKVTRFAPPSELDVFILRPNKEKASTLHARNALPKQVSRKDAQYNSSHIATLVCGFANSNYDLIVRGMDDKIAEPARAKAGFLEGLEELKASAKEYGYGASASGAGPALIALGISGSEKREFEEEAKSIFSRKGLQVETWWTKVSEKGVTRI
ncbi:MAG: homoserine kinase [Candidatus Micrarchaeia archaeon]